MRILLVHNRYTQRGGEDSVFEAESALLREHGHEVVTWEEDNTLLEGASKLKAATNTVWSFGSQKTLRRLIDQHKPEVVHFHNTFLRVSPAAYYACQAAGVPVVQSLHNYRLLCPAANLFREGHVCEECTGTKGLWPSVQHRCWHDSRAQTAVVASMLTFHRWLRTWQTQVDFYIALTEFARQKFIAGGLPADKITVKPNFVKAPSAPASEASARSPFALYVGRLSEEKGIHFLVNAWRNLAEVPLKIVGDGPLRGELEDVVRQAGLSQVEFCGRQPAAQVASFMQSARLLIVPSVCYEGLPLTIVEAFSRHLPVLASNLGAMAETVAHGETGLLFQVNDAADLGKWVRWAWANLDELERFANNAHQVYQHSYTPEHNYPRLMEIYQRAIARHTKLQPATA